MAMDGCAGSFCDISISVAESWSTPYRMLGTGALILSITPVYPYKAYCPITHRRDLLSLVCRWPGNRNQTGDTLDIQWVMAGTFELCVDVSNPCVPATENPIPQCMTVTVTDVMGDDPEPVVICSDDTYSYGWFTISPRCAWCCFEHTWRLRFSCDLYWTVYRINKPIWGTFIFVMGELLNVGNTSLSCNNEGPQEVILSQSTYPFCARAIRPLIFSV